MSIMASKVGKTRSIEEATRSYRFCLRQYGGSKMLGQSHCCKSIYRNAEQLPQLMSDGSNVHQAGLWRWIRQNIQVAGVGALPCATDPNILVLKEQYLIW